MSRFFRVFVFSYVFAGLLASGPASDAAELFEVPSGVVVRRAESESGLEVFSDGKKINAASDRDCLINRSEFCKPISYRVTGTEWRHLLKFCGKEKTETSFLFIGDTQQSQVEHDRTAALIARLKSENPDVRFILNAGDLVQEATPAAWKNYQNTAMTYDADLPLVPVLGNHEHYGDRTLANREKFYGWPETSRHYYVLDYDGFALFVLDSNLDQMTKEQRAAQTEWLNDQLKVWSSRKPVLVTYHHPGYSSAWMVVMLPNNPRYVRNHWLPLFAKYGVKLVLNGHEHLYERLVTRGVPTLVAGPAAGGWGRVRPGGSRHSLYVRKKSRTVSLVKVRASGRVDIQTWDTGTGEMFDEWNL